MLLNIDLEFMKSFFEGTKIHAILEDKNDKWKPGKVIRFINRAENKNCTQLSKGICFSTQSIEVRPVFRKTDYNTYSGVRHNVYISDRLLSSDEVWQLATHEGFENTAAFFDRYNHNFKGKIIHWTNFSY